MDFVRFLRNNTPANKPELWRHFPRAFVRQGFYRWKKMTCRLDAPLGVVYDGDIRLEVRLRDAIGRSVYVYGVYESALTALFDRYLTPGRSFADIGAHMGYYTLLAAQRIGPAGRVYAFEAAPRLFEQLEANVRRNRFPNIHLYKKAVAAQSGPILFYCVDDPDNTGLSSLRQPSGVALPIQVESISLDDFMDREAAGPLHLIKMDVEGAEGMVLQGAQKLLASPQAPDFILENNNQDEQVFALLRNAGYALYDVWSDARRDLVLSPQGTYPVDTMYRFYETRNLFAAKRIPDALKGFLG